MVTSGHSGFPRLPGPGTQESRLLRGNLLLRRLKAFLPVHYPIFHPICPAVSGTTGRFSSRKRDNSAQRALFLGGYPGFPEPQSPGFPRSRASPPAHRCTVPGGVRWCTRVVQGRQGTPPYTILATLPEYSSPTPPWLPCQSTPLPQEGRNLALSSPSS